MSTRIREFRKLRGMTLQHLAQKVGTTAQTIQRLETDNMTVSLDWLQRIAEVFGMPAAALLVTDKTASVAVLGDLDGAGEVTLADPAGPSTTLSLVIAAPHPVAVRVVAAISTPETNRSFDDGTLLICGKIEVDPAHSFEPRDCLVAYRDGKIRFCSVSIEAGVVSIIAQRPKGSRTPGDGSVEWIAPLLMAVRFF